MGDDSDRASRWHPATLRAAFWTWRAARRAARSYEGPPFGPPTLPRVPAVPEAARRGMLGVLRRSRASCLIRATVVQAWEAAHGRPRDLLIGVTSPGSGFRAHAWLDGDPPHSDEGYVELFRHPAAP